MPEPVIVGAVRTPISPVVQGDAGQHSARDALITAIVPEVIRLFSASILPISTT